MKYYIADGINLGVDTINRKVVLEWGNAELGALVAANLTPEQVGKLEVALKDALRQLQNTPSMRISL